MEVNPNNHESSLHENEIEQGWLSTQEAAKYLGISPGNLRLKIHRGQIQVQGRLGRRLKFKKYDLDQILEDQVRK